MLAYVCSIAAESPAYLSCKQRQYSAACTHIHDHPAVKVGAVFHDCQMIGASPGGVLLVWHHSCYMINGLGKSYDFE